jgi:aryl carrier-like protein
VAEGAANSEVFVTPEMIEAGLSAVRDLRLQPDWRAAVTAIYYAMELERLANEALRLVDQGG